MAEGGRKSAKFDEAIRLAKAEDGPVFYGPKDKWMAQEELVLLASMKHFGYGNWPKHADVLTKNIEDKEFTAEEVREHYIKTYREGEIAEAMKPLRSGIFKSSVIDHVSEKNFEKLKVSDVDSCIDLPQEFLNLVGYNPFRHEFEQDYEPMAEDMIQTVQLRNVDPFDKNYNLILLDCYRYKVKERMRMRKLIQEYRLLERFYEASGFCELLPEDYPNDN